MSLFEYQIITYVDLAVAAVCLAYGSYTDYSRRTVNSFLFVPVMVAGIFVNIFFRSPLPFTEAGILLLFLTFLRTDLMAYLVAGSLFFIFSFFIMFHSGFYFGFQFLVISLVYLLGFRETLFGIGDIKAMASLMYSFPFLISLSRRGITPEFSTIPSSIILLVSITLLSLVWAVYGMFLAGRSPEKKSGIFAMKYSEDMLSKHPSAFQVKERNGVRYMLYRVPFMVPIFLGFILYILTGSLI